MTPEQLKEIEQRWEKATPGPWFLVGDGLEIHDRKTRFDENGSRIESTPNLLACFETFPNGKDNAVAIASAPADIANLLAEVRKLQEKLQYEETCHAEAQEEVRRLNRMVDKAIEKLSEFGCVVDTDPCPANYVEVGCAECVRKYLESEAANNG